MNFFAQRNIGSFLPGKEAYSRPLVWKLQKATYRRYVQLWQRFIYFVIRYNDPLQQLPLRHRLTGRQTASLDTALARGSERLTHPSISTMPLDRACLEVCISLLDHPLAGGIFESAVVSFDEGYHS